MLDPSQGHLVPCTLGSGPDQRIGKRITLKSIHIQILVEYPPVLISVLPANPTTICLALVLDMMTNGVQMTGPQLYNVAEDPYLCVLPTRNMSNSEKFKVLRFERFDLCSETAYSGAEGNPFCWSGKQKVIDWFVPLDDLQMNFDANATTDAEISQVADNSLHLWGVTSISNTDTKIQYRARTRFVG